MNQPRHNDNGGGESGNSWRDTYPANRRSVAHSTGRSNYGGSSGRRNNNNSNRGGDKNNNNNNNEKGPIGKWIQNRRQRRLRRQRSSNGGAVGTEANAIENMRRNAKHFNYPQEGFVTPIEHSLLYAMIEFPERYPESVVKNEIEEEEFDEYLFVNDNRKGNFNDNSRGGGEQRNSENGEEGGEENDIAEEEAPSSHLNDEEAIVAYAQLSALAALSAEKNPATASKDPNTPAALRNKRDKPPKKNDNTNINTEEQLSIGQTLVRKLLKTITRYSDSHSLDRQNEIREFLTPIERRCQLRNEKAALQQLLPAYAGYTLSLVTGNPLPLLIGAAALTGPDPMLEENNNVSTFRSVGGRAGDIETAGLLDECESD